MRAGAALRATTWASAAPARAPPTSPGELRCCCSPSRGDRSVAGNEGVPGSRRPASAAVSEARYHRRMRWLVALVSLAVVHAPGWAQAGCISATECLCQFNGPNTIAELRTERVDGPRAQVAVVSATTF